VFSTQSVEAIQRELANADQARGEGNEGRARVCARRAAGAAIREYFRLIGQPGGEGSAYDLLRFLQTQQGLPPQVGETAGHLMARVDTHHNLPVDADLLAETRWLVRELQRLVG
jgi:hypothetical protein